MQNLTPTSYAILGHLAIKSWSAYELAGRMQATAVRQFWPRVASRIYEEPKNLVAHGLARMSKEANGKRERAVYHITAKGRRALEAWLSAPTEGEQLHDEFLLKLYFCDQGSAEQLRANIRAARARLLEMLKRVQPIAAEVAVGRRVFPERVHLTALLAEYYLDRACQRADYLDWLEEHVRSWRETSLSKKKLEAAQSTIERNQARLVALLERLKAQVDELEAVDYLSDRSVTA